MNKEKLDNLSASIFEGKSVDVSGLSAVDLTNANTRGQTLLYVAARFQNIFVLIELLLLINKLRIDTANIKNSDGSTPLDGLFWNIYKSQDPQKTITKNTNRIIVILIENNVSPRLKDKVIYKDFNKYDKLIDSNILEILKIYEKQSNTKLAKELLLSKILKSTYNEGLEFPPWVIKHIFENDQTYDKLMSKSKLYYFEDPDNRNIIRTEIKKLAYEREPVNMLRNQLYDKTKLQSLLGWSTGYYDRYFEINKKLLPNIGIYCETPYTTKPSCNLSASTQVQPQMQPTDTIKIFNVIGYAFDNINQSDYKYFSKYQIDEKNNQMKLRYKHLFYMTIQCAFDNGIKTVYMPVVGANNFAIMYNASKKYFQENVWIPAFNEFMADFGNRFGNIQYIFYGLDKTVDEDSKKKLLLNGIIETHDRVPEVFDIAVKNNTANTSLFINAWDMLSIVGNGNCKDSSIDGYIGRNTAVSLLSWPGANKYLQDETKYKQISLPSIEKSKAFLTTPIKSKEQMNITSNVNQLIPSITNINADNANLTVENKQKFYHNNKNWVIIGLNTIKPLDMTSVYETCIKNAENGMNKWNVIGRGSFYKISVPESTVRQPFERMSLGTLYYPILNINLDKTANIYLIMEYDTYYTSKSADRKSLNAIREKYDTCYNSGKINARTKMINDDEYVAVQYKFIKNNNIQGNFKRLDDKNAFLDMKNIFDRTNTNIFKMKNGMDLE